MGLFSKNNLGPPPTLLDSSGIGPQVLAILLMTASVIAVAPAAHAGEGGALAAGLLGGLAAGTMIGIAASNPYPPPPPPVYIAPEPVACYWTRGRPYWDGFGWVYPRVRVCE
jgi:hypothetical protein